MQLRDKDGIACDSCGTTYKKDFTYYSFDFRHVSVHSNRKPSLDSIVADTIITSLDICPTCYDKISKTIVNNYGKSMSSVRRQQQGTLCEISNTKLVGTYSYYYVIVSKVVVKITGQPFICATCKAVCQNNKCSKCQQSNIIRPALVDVSDRVLEISVCENVYNEYLMTAGKVREVAGAWSTNS